MSNWDTPLWWIPDKIRMSHMTTEMKVDSFVAKLQFARRLWGDNVHSLPPGNPAYVIHLDALPGAPKDWVRGPGSYVVPVDTDLGLWFDWRGDDHVNQAVLPSVKGMNPLTGRKIEELRLEAYVEKCPVHGEPFKGSNRMCEKCGWEWPPQNYVSGRGKEPMWWDGFRTGDTVRQFFFSEDDKKDIASLVLGKNTAVPAFGFAFWRAKIPIIPPPPPRPPDSTPTPTLTGTPPPYVWQTPTPTWGYPTPTMTSTCTSTPTGTPPPNKPPSQTCTATATATPKPPSHTPEPGRKPRNVSVGAGAEIDQKLSPDPLGIEGWQPGPAAIIRLYFVFQEQFADICEQGIVDIKGKKLGYMDGMPVG